MPIHAELNIGPQEQPQLPPIPKGEGWLICFYPDPKAMGESFHHYQIQADLDGDNDEDTPFQTDEEAISFVASRAKEGSTPHIDVLDFLAKHCPSERELVRKETGY